MDEMTELEQFQNFIDELALRNKSILDQMTKLQDANSRLNRHIAKCATTCGCITLHINKQQFSLQDTVEYGDLNSLLSSHVEGYPCASCNELLEKEMGRILFYLGAMANTLGISLSTVLENEKNRTSLLSHYCLK
ncbi:MAG: hypothetical protein ACRCWY_14550 [Cellulosilyticaceae bacterium]